MSERLSPLSSPAATREVLEDHGLATKHALGQNFLVNDHILRKIIDLAEVSEADMVLEVGPGIGTLTIALLKHAAAVIAIERDPDLPAVLTETLAPWQERFLLIEKDALDVSVGDIEGAVDGLPRGNRGGTHSLRQSSRENGESHSREALDRCGTRSVGTSPIHSAQASSESRCYASSFGMPNKLVSNLPYAVAATVVLDYFQRFASIGSATVMVQKEVADRMAAKPGTKDYGAYTLKLSLYAKPVGRFPVGPSNFFPPPRVESAVIRLDRIQPCDEAGVPLTPDQIERACLWADAAFANRRKTLANSCKTYFASRGPEGAALAANLSTIFDRASIDPRRRGETLTPEDLIRLTLASLLS